MDTTQHAVQDNPLVAEGKELINMLRDMLLGRTGTFDGIHGKLELTPKELAQFNPYYNYFVAMSDVHLILVVHEDTMQYAISCARLERLPNLLKHIHFGMNTDPCTIVSASKFSQLIQTMNFKQKQDSLGFENMLLNH